MPVCQTSITKLEIKTPKIYALILPIQSCLKQVLHNKMIEIEEKKNPHSITKSSSF